MTSEAQRNEDTVEPLVRLRIEVVGEDGDACRNLLRDLCDMIDADLAGAAGYSVSKIEGSASCDVDTLPNSTWTTQGHRETLAAGHRKLGYVETLQGGFALVASVYDRAGRRHQRPFYDHTDARTWVEENAAT